MQSEGKLSDVSWERLQGSVIGYSYDEHTQRLRKLRTYENDPRFESPPFSTHDYVTGVIRHHVRATLA